MEAKTSLQTTAQERRRVMRAMQVGAWVGVLTLASCGGGGPGSPDSPGQPGESATVKISTSTVTVSQGGTWGFTANVPVVWSVREGVVGGTITDQGVYTAPQADGIFHVVATSKADSTKRDTSTVTVPPVAVAVLPSAVGLAPGQTFIFAAEITGTINTAAAWSVQEGAAGGAITDTGEYTAPTTLGTFHVVAASLVDPSSTGTARVSVISSPPMLTPSGSMTVGRADHSATLLPNGKLLVAGGISEVTEDCGCGLPLSTAETFDPTSGSFSTSGQMMQPRASHTATLLENGRVLLAGGASNLAAELFDPASGTFVLTGNMEVARVGHTATLLRNGRVLIAGGSGSRSTEVFDPSAETFSSSANMTTTRSAQTATLLLDGRVLITGGIDTSGEVLATAELFDPANGTFIATNNMTAGRAFHTATLLPDGRVLVAGGTANRTTSVPLATAELFDPAQGTFTATADMLTARSGHTATALASGKVFVTGGAGSPLAEVFDPASSTFAVVSRMTTVRSQHAATLLSDGTVLISGGFDDSSSDQALASTELYSPK